MQLWNVEEIEMWLAKRDLEIYFPTKDTIPWKTPKENPIPKKKPPMKQNGKLKNGEKKVRARNEASKSMSI